MFCICSVPIEIGIRVIIIIVPLSCVVQHFVIKVQCVNIFINIYMYICLQRFNSGIGVLWMDEYTFGVQKNLKCKIMLRCSLWLKHPK